MIFSGLNGSYPIHFRPIESDWPTSAMADKQELELLLILKIKRTRLTFRALPEKLLPFLPDALFVTIDAAAELDRCVSIAS